MSGILYEIIHDASRSTDSVETPKLGAHADGVVGSVKSPTVESLDKQLHEFPIKHSTTEAAKDSPSPQNEIFFAQSSQKDNQQPSGKKKKGKKCEGNQNKPKLTDNTDGGKKEKKKVKFPCKLYQEDHLTHQCPLIDQAQKLQKGQQPTVLKDPFPQG